MFSSAFSSAFAGRAGYVGPVCAQALLTDGAAWSVAGSGLLVAGKRLIGPAGKVFVFASSETAARWVDNAKNIGIQERALIAAIDPAAAEIWKAKKREKLAVIAARVVSAAARTADADKRAALIAEAGYLLGKWAG